MKKNSHSTASQGEQASAFEPCAQLFILVLNDPSIRPLIRIWFARLQEPMRQLASADPMGFQHANHPARRLLVTLSDYALGKGAYELPCGLLEQEIKRLVLWVESTPQVGPQVFEQVGKAFDEFLASTRLQPIPADCSICLQEQQQALTAQFQKAIMNALLDTPVQNSIRDFVFQVWAPIMAAHAVRHGLEHPDNLNLKHTCVELIQVSADLFSPTARKVAIGKFPKLVQLLCDGMNWMGIAAKEQEQHIQKIGSDLSEAFIASRSAQAPVAPTPTRQDARLGKLIFVPKVRSTAANGMLVSDENTDTDWYLWECTLAEQTAKPKLTEPMLLPDVPSTMFQDTQPSNPCFWDGYPNDKL